jgi:hypothetical protein
MPKTLLVALLAAALAGPGTTLTAQAPADAELEAGIRLAQEGEFDQAVLALDRVVQRLGTRSDRARDRARALVYLSVAHLGLNRRVTARERLLEARRVDPRVELTSREFPPSVMEFFEEVRREARPAPPPAPVVAPTPAPTPRPAASPTPAPPPAAASAPAKKKGGGSGGLILIGLGAAGAGVALAARGSGDAGPTPQATPTPDPRTVVTPGFTFGPARITLSSMTPAPGSTISGCGADLGSCAGRLGMQFTINPATLQGQVALTVLVFDANRTTCLWTGFLPQALSANQTTTRSVTFMPRGTCRPPTTMTTMRASIWNTAGDTELAVQEWSFTYSFAP